MAAEWGPEESAEVIRRTLVADWPGLEQLFDFRSIVEQQVAMVAARRRRPDDARAIRSALADYLCPS